MKMFTFIWIMLLVGLLGRRIYIDAAPRFGAGGTEQQQAAPPPVGYGWVWWYPDDILYSGPTTDYPLKGESMIVNGFNDVWMD